MKVFLFALSFVFLLACQENKIKPPQTLLPDTIMIDMIIDAFVLNAAYAETFGAVRDSVSDAFSEQLFHQHNVPKEIFQENMEWLNLHPEKLDLLYDKVLEKLDTIEEDMHTKRYQTRK